MRGLSPSAGTKRYELWVFCANGVRMPVQACGFFHTRGQAMRASSLLSDWLNGGPRPVHLLGACADAGDRLELLELPDMLTSLGADPALAQVTVEAVGPRLYGDNETVAPWERDPGTGAGDDDDGDDDDDLEDTALELPAVVYAKGDDDLFRRLSELKGE